MVEEIVFEIAVLVFTLLVIGIGLTIYDFHKYVNPPKKKKNKNNE